MKGVANKVLTNWGETFSCSPQLYFEPSNEMEIREIIEKAKINNKKVCALKILTIKV